MRKVYIVFLISVRLEPSLLMKAVAGPKRPPAAFPGHQTPPAAFPRHQMMPATLPGPQRAAKHFSPNPVNYRVFQLLVNLVWINFRAPSSCLSHSVQLPLSGTCLVIKVNQTR